MTTILKGILAESQNGGAGNALSALVDKVGAAMQGSTQTPISGLLDRLSGGGNEPQPATANGAPINYAPVSHTAAGIATVNAAFMSRTCFFLKDCQLLIVFLSLSVQACRRRPFAGISPSSL